MTAILAVLLCSFWNPAASPQTNAGQSGVSLRVDVELITAEVIVLDKKGNPIRNLKREDFQLFEDGKRQEIVTFAEVTDEPREVPTSLADVDGSMLNRGKVVLILFDDSHITNGQLHTAREAAETYVKEQMRPADLFAVASYGLSLKLHQNFTNDPAKVIEGIRRPAVSFANPSQNDRGPAIPGQPQAGREPEFGAPSPKSAGPSLEVRARILDLFRALRTLSASVSAVRGRKAVIMFSEDFSASVDVQSEMQNAVTVAKRANVAFYTVDIRGLNPTGEIREYPGKPANRPAGQAMRAANSLRSLFGRLASGMVFPGSGFSGPAAFSLIQQGGGGQSGGQGGGGTGGGGTGGGGTGGGGTGGGGTGGGGTGGGAGGGGGTAPPGGGSTGGNTPGGTGGNNPGGNTNPNPAFGNPSMPGRDFGRDNQGADFARFSQPLFENMLRSLASQTGGVAIFNTSDFNGRLNAVTRELNNYYVIGFQSNNPKRDGAFRRLDIKTQVKGEVRHREGYVDPRPLDVLAGSKGEKSMMSAINASVPATMLPIVSNALFFYDSQALARIPVVARIRTAEVELKKKGKQLVGDLNVMGIAYSEDGSVSARFSETLHLAMEKEQESQFRGTPLAYRNHLRLRPGKYRLKIAVADEKGRVGSSEQALLIPPMKREDLAASSIVVVEQAAKLPPLIQDLQTKLLDDSDPLIFRGLQVFPSVENQVAAGKPVNVIFRLYNLGSAQGRKLVAEARLTDSKGATVALPRIDLEQYLVPTGDTDAVVGLGLLFPDIGPGKYTLAIETSEEPASRKVSLQTEVQFK